MGEDGRKIKPEFQNGSVSWECVKLLLQGRRVEPVFLIRLGRFKIQCLGHVLVMQERGIVGAWLACSNQSFKRPLSSKGD